MSRRQLIHIPHVLLASDVTRVSNLSHEVRGKCSHSTRARLGRGTHFHGSRCHPLPALFHSTLLSFPAKILTSFLRNVWLAMRTRFYLAHVHSCSRVPVIGRMASSRVLREWRVYLRGWGSKHVLGYLVDLVLSERVVLCGHLLRPLVLLARNSWRGVHGSLVGGASRRRSLCTCRTLLGGNHHTFC